MIELLGVFGKYFVLFGLFAGGVYVVAYIIKRIKGTGL